MDSIDRLRQHPKERLAAPVQHIDLASVASDLRAEPHAPVSGHRQIAVVREGPVTVIFFLFDAGGHLKEHRTEGEVTIHVLAGRLEIGVDDERHELTAGQLLALAPGVAHSVRALTESQMLLTVHRHSMM
jgi:quercetin dioxygenase-like cupin family protein